MASFFSNTQLRLPDIDLAELSRMFRVSVNNSTFNYKREGELIA
jgi:hypothetical protein